MKLTVKELKNQLNKFPEDMEIYLVDIIEGNDFPLEFKPEDPIFEIGKTPGDFYHPDIPIYDVLYFPVYKKSD